MTGQHQICLQKILKLIFGILTNIFIRLQSCGSSIFFLVNVLNETDSFQTLEDSFVSCFVPLFLNPPLHNSHIIESHNKAKLYRRQSKYLPFVSPSQSHIQIIQILFMHVIMSQIQEKENTFSRNEKEYWTLPLQFFALISLL